MFKKLDRKDISTSSQVKTSVQRHLKSELLEKHSNLTEEQVDALFPKKSPLVQYKLGSYTMIYCQRKEVSDDKERSLSSSSDVPMLFQDRDGPILPCLKLVHQYPTLDFRRVTVDQGAIPFLLGGANVMCPGLTKVPGGEMPPDESPENPGLKPGDGVVIYAQGKEYAIGVGIMKMSSAQIRSKNKGLAIELLHYLGDGLYQLDEI